MTQFIYILMLQPGVFSLPPLGSLITPGIPPAILVLVSRYH